MRTRALTIAVLTGLLVLAASGTAGAATQLGITVKPFSSTGSTCPVGTIIAQLGDDPSTPYIVPVGGGFITAWDVNTSAPSTAGGPLTFVVLRPVDSTHYRVIGVDSESVPTPLPASNVASFTLPSPIQVVAGDTFGMFSTGGVACYWGGGGTPAGDKVTAVSEPTVPTVGTTLTASGSGADLTVNVGATLERSDDAAVTAATAPAAPAAGNLAVLSAAVTNAGVIPGTIIFTDHVPAGLTVNSASAGDGSCVHSAQTVTCTLTGLPAGHTAPVNVIVTPGASGLYTNNVTVAAGPGLTDLNLANNSASATLRVGPRLVVARCVVRKLKGIPGALAKRVLGLLGCTVKLTHAHSRKIARGHVIGTHPGTGTYTFGARVKLVVSSGR